MHAYLQECRLATPNLFREESIMKEQVPKKHVYVKRFRRESDPTLLQMAIIFTFIFIAILVSLWLPAYFAHLPLGGF